MNKRALYSQLTDSGIWFAKYYSDMRILVSATTGVISLAIFFFTLIAVPRTLLAAEFSNHLYETLSSKSGDDFVSVLVFMSDQLDVNQVRTNYKLSSYSRQANHKIILNELKRFSETSQRDFQELLSDGLIHGDVHSFESYWIANALQVEATGNFVESLSERNDIEIIVLDLPPQSLYYPQHSESAYTTANVGQGVPEGLRAIGADSMWAMGYTGEGTLVATFDTGVWGDHPALRKSWRGNTHSVAESWYDPVYRENYPHWKLDEGSHGTQTMGVIVGMDDSTGDTTGVAWGAQWISAMVVDILGANYLEAFQWVADPDGDPNTIDDVPDVLSNSWGFRLGNLNCLDIFWTAIDNVEALGTVVVFACGNEGPDSLSLRNPANRATTIYNTFSVGMINPHYPSFPIHEESSRGPSDCDSVSKKPEVVAPGVTIRTTTASTDPNNLYTNSVYGTSYAAPHVAGAVALLRQHNPNASVDTIKAALMNSARGLGEPGEDNSYGHGIIYIPDALDLMPENDQVNIYIKSLTHDSIVPGDTVDVVINLKNSGYSTHGVNGLIVNSDLRITLLQDSAYFGDLPMDSTIGNNENPYRLVFDPSVPDGEMLDIDLYISASGRYHKTTKVYFRVGEQLVKSSYLHSSDSVKFTISNYGIYGLAAGSFVNRGGMGFVYNATGVNNLFQCGLMIGTDYEHVSNGIINLIGSANEDFQVTFGGNLQEFSPGDLGDHETFSRFTDENALNPIGITVAQRTASYLTPPHTNYVIVEYLVTNNSASTLENMYIGLYFDWDFPFGNAGSDMTGFDSTSDLGYHWDDYYEDDYRGTTVLSSKGASTFFPILNKTYIYNNEGYSGPNDSIKYMFLTAGTDSISPSYPKDQSYSIATGPFTLAPGESDTAAFAVLAAASIEQLRNIAAQAKENYRQATPVEGGDDLALPEKFSLHQNYPNPFNPATTISYSIARPGRVTLTLFNILGQEIITLLDQEQPAGHYSIRWDGADSYGNSIASGVYFYRLKVGEFSEVKKMLLLK